MVYLVTSRLINRDSWRGLFYRRPVGSAWQTISVKTSGGGRFRLWGQVVDWIIQQLFELPSLLDGHQAAQERASNPDLNWLRQVCLAAEEDARLDEELTASGILEICKGHSLDIPGLANDAPDEKAALLRIGSHHEKDLQGERVHRGRWF